MNDLRFALRKLRQSPAATLTAIATLALGIGANTAVFSVVSSVLLASLPFADSQQLVRVVVSRTQADGRTLQTSPAAVDFHSLRNQSRLLERVAAQRYQDVALNSDQTAAERITGIAVSDQWLETLRVKPLLGRDFDHGEQAEGDRSDTTLISYAFWQRYFGGNTQAIGKTLRLNDRNYTVIGVMPREFQYPYQADVWFPMTLSPTATAPSDLNIVGRLKSGVSDKQFADELHFIAAQVAKDFPAKAGMNLVARRFDAEFNRDPNRSILALVIAVAFVLAVACVNIANLQLARGQARIHEMAIRSAIGASKWSQMRLLLTESLVLAGFGGVFGLVLTFWGLDWLVMLIPSRVGEVVQHIRVDASVLIFAIGVCLLTTLLFGLAPALQFSQEKPAAALKNIGRCNTRAGGWITSLSIVTQVALAFVLLTGASFMSQNLLRLLGTDVGYEPANLLKVELTLPSPRYDEAARRVRAVNQILQSVQTIPGVVAAGATSLQPIPHTTTNELTAIVLERFADPTLLTTVNQRIVSASYFRTMGMRIIKGRGFADADTEISSPVLIVNETAARRFWPAGDPIGERLKPGRTEDTRVDWHTIVGVVNNIAEPDREDETLGTIYRVYPQATKSQSPTSWGTTSISLLIRGIGDSNTLLHEIRDTVGRIDSSLLLYEASSMKEALSKPLSSQRFGTGLFIGFGAFGLFLAALGTYGVIASSVSQRTPEFGIRIAIGARPIDLLRLVVSQGMRLVTLGLVIGTLAALLLSRAVAVVTTQINARNPLTFAAAAIALLLAGLLASWIPARRASRVDPIIALRSE